MSAHGGPIEIEVARKEVALPLSGVTAEVPTMSPVSLIALAFVLAALGAYRLRRHAA